MFNIPFFCPQIRGWKTFQRLEKCQIRLIEVWFQIDSVANFDVVANRVGERHRKLHECNRQHHVDEIMTLRLAYLDQRFWWLNWSLRFLKAVGPFDVVAVIHENIAELHITHGDFRESLLYSHTQQCSGCAHCLPFSCDTVGSNWYYWQIVSHQFILIDALFPIISDN